MIRAIVAIALIVVFCRVGKRVTNRHARNDTTWNSGVTWAGGTW